MTAQNLKATVDIVYSENADYSDEEWSTNWDAYEIDPDEAALHLTITAATAGTTIDVVEMDLTSGAAALLAIKNTDSTNYVQVGWTDLSTTACVARVLAGGVLVIPAINPGTNVVLTANGAAVKCKVVIAQA